MKSFNINNIICINLKQHSYYEIFLISEWYNLDFEILIELDLESSNNPNNFNGKIWINLELMEIIAYEYTYYDDEKTPIIKIDIKNEYIVFFDDISVLGDMKPVKTPKLVRDQRTYTLYKFYLNKGYNIQNDALDIIIDKFEKKMELKSLKDMENLLKESIESENYEKAAELRDMIYNIKNKK